MYCLIKTPPEAQLTNTRSTFTRSTYAQRNAHTIATTGSKICLTKMLILTLRLRIVLTINGGAAVALLAFVAALASKADRTLQQLNPIVSQLKWFIVGVITSGVAAALAYVTS
jgi:hypothetical protein